jgi:hypothetical protein
MSNNQRVGGNLTVIGNTTLTGASNTTNDLGIGGNFYVSGNEVITGTTTMVGQANTTNDLGIGNNLYSANAVVATKGLYSKTSYVGPYTDGIVVDYTSGTGRISVGSGDGVTFYTGTDATRTPIFNVSSSGVITTGTWQATTVGIAYGGTNNTSFTNNTLTYYNGSSIVSLANVSSINTSISANNTVNNVTVDGFGRVLNYTTQAISGLTVPQGGTGFNTATANGIIFGNGTGALQATAMAGTSDQTWSNQILTVTNTGAPVWSSALDGGNF